MPVRTNRKFLRSIFVIRFIARIWSVALVAFHAQAIGVFAERKRLFPPIGFPEKAPLVSEVKNGQIVAVEPDFF